MTMKPGVLLTALLLIASPAAPAHADFVEDLVDVSHTIGKSKQERERIILERRAQRFTKKAGKSVGEGVKATGKAVRAFGKSVRTSAGKKSL